MQYGLTTDISPTRDWQFNCRGSRLVADDFDTKLLIRTGDQPLCAVLVLAVAALNGQNSSGQRVVSYPLFAAVAVDRQTLSQLLDRGRVTPENTFQTMSEAKIQAETINAKTYRSHQDSYELATLSAVHAWSKVDSTDISASIPIAAPANAQAATKASLSGLAS